MESLLNSGTLLPLMLAGALGLAFGRVRFFGVELGLSGALFAGLLLGHLGWGGAAAPLEFARDLGLSLFVYAVGLQVGPGFFTALRRDGALLNGLAIAVVGLGVLTLFLVRHFFHLPLAALLGVMSGATTSTPSLAAAQQVLQASPEGAGAAGLAGMGYALTYPFGIIGIIVSMILLRRGLRVNVAAEASAFERSRGGDAPALESASIEVCNRALEGLLLRDFSHRYDLKVVLSRHMHGGATDLARPDDRMALGDVVVAVGPVVELEKARRLLGASAGIDLIHSPSVLHSVQMVVTQPKILGRTVSQLDLRHSHNVTLSRVHRAGVDLLPAPTLKLQFGDVVTAIGSAEALHEVGGVLGNNPQSLQIPKLLPVLLGLALGMALGQLPLPLPGLPSPIRLGLAGGPLIAAILLSRLGHIGRLVWFLPSAAQLALRDFGIVLFLASVGIKSGGHLAEILASGSAPAWILSGFAITLGPVLVVGALARLLLRMNFLTIIGLMAGSMTDTPALAFANAQHPGSSAPSLAYATVYPLVVFLRVLAPQLLVLVLS